MNRLPPDPDLPSAPDDGLPELGQQYVHDVRDTLHVTGCALGNVVNRDARFIHRPTGVETRLPIYALILAGTVGLPGPTAAWHALFPREGLEKLRDALIAFLAELPPEPH